jgi:hypothetical protein
VPTITEITEIASLRGARMLAAGAGSGDAGGTSVSSTRGPRARGARADGTGAVAAAVAVAALIVGGCGDPTPFAQEGIGFGPSQSFAIEAGSYAISWSAWDDASPRDGCVFGLLLDMVSGGPVDEAGEQVSFSLPKLEYRVIDDAGALNGRTALLLPAATYRFVIEGSCAWSVRVDSH